MVFATVGTHEQQFNRLVESVDKWAYGHNEEVVIQTGFSTYEPQNCVWSRFYSYDTMREMVEKARIVITHGGPSSFMMALQIGKIPIVIPRSSIFDEHVNNHQIDFCKKVAEEKKSIILVENTDELEDIIDRYDEIISAKQNVVVSNNKLFCSEFSKIVEELIK